MGKNGNNDPQRSQEHWPDKEIGSCEDPVRFESPRHRPDKEASCSRGLLVYILGEADDPKPLCSLTCHHSIPNSSQIEVDARQYSEKVGAAKKKPGCRKEARGADK